MTEINAIPYEELLQWYRFLELRPIGWREDNRAAIVAMSLGGSKDIKPGDLFASLRQIEKQQVARNKTNFAEKFMNRFSNKLSEKKVVEEHA